MWPSGYSGRGRWYLNAVDSGGELFHARTFQPLFGAGLAAGWDEHDDEGPMRMTEAGRKLADELEEQVKAERAAKLARSKPSPDGPTAMRLLREIAEHDQPALIHDDGQRRVWRLGSRDGFRASVDIWVALARAGRICIERVSSIGGHRVTVTDAGRQRLTRTRTGP